VHSSCGVLDAGAGIGKLWAASSNEFVDIRQRETSNFHAIKVLTLEGNNASQINWLAIYEVVIQNLRPAACLKPKRL
jgi:hypothetical protein